MSRPEHTTFSRSKVEKTIRVLAFELAQRNISELRFHEISGELKALKDFLEGHYA